MSGKSETKTTKYIVGFAGESDIKTFFSELEQQDRKFDEYIIAYIDFLGIKKKILSNETSFESLRILQFILSNAQKKAAYITETNTLDDFSIKVFSDNVVIAQKVNKERLCDQLISIVNLVSLIQFEAFFQFNFPLRGGITVGELYIDNSIVWGTGLIDAYYMESSVANYPRVLVSKQVLDVYEKSDSKSLNLYALIKQDFDGIWFVDFFTAAPNLSLIPEISASLRDKALSSKNDIREKQKLNWIIFQFNQMCHKFSNRGDYDKYMIPYI